MVLFATQFIGEAEEAADIVQGVFCRFWVNRRFSFVTGKFGTLSFLGSKTRMFELFAKYPSAEGKYEQISDELYDEVSGENSGID